VEECLKVACRWKTPTNWAPRDWQEELRGVALLAGWEALQSYKPHYGVPLKWFVKRRAMAALLQRYREEWRFACHCRNEGQICEELGKVTRDGVDEEVLDGVALLVEMREFEKCWQSMEVRDLLSLLSPQERYLLEWLICDGATEREAAAELGLSQPTVSRWKRKVLQKLRDMLSGQT
jgi:RNA polymerase sigma factor (sigma-70 family)